MDKRIIEYILALCALTWGLWLVLPFDTCNSSATFVFLCTAAPEWFWGLLLLGSGTFLLLGDVRESRCIRRSALVILALTWFAVWIGFAIGNWRSTAAVNYLWWFVLSAYAYMRVGRNGVANKF
jgi:hypothetical protein